MEQQPNGEVGALITNYANIFYIKDVNGVRRMVSVLWVSDGWYIDAYSVPYPDTWHAMSRIFS